MEFSDARRRLAATLLLAVAAAGCAAPTAPDEIERDQDRAQLAAARSLWNAQRLSSYDLRSQNQCFCTSDVRAPVRLEVRGGQIAGVVRIDTGTRLEPATFSRYRTVDSLFDFIGQALSTQAEVVEVRYDRAFGYPISVFIDPTTLAADEETRIETSDLVPR